MSMIVSTILEWYQHSRAGSDGKFLPYYEQSQRYIKRLRKLFFHKIYGKLSVDESNDI